MTVAVERADAWAKVGVPAGPVGDALKDFWTDGGMERLRVMLTRYVVADGLRALADDVAVQAEALRAEHDQFRELVAVRERAQSAQVEIRRRRLEAIAALRRHAIEVGRAAAQELRNPRRSPAEGVPSLREQLERRCANLVWSWPEWQLLFGAVDANRNLVVVPRDAGTPLAAVSEPPAEPAAAPGASSEEGWMDEWDPGKPPLVATAVPLSPVMAEGLLDPFVRSCAELREKLRELVAGHVDTWCRARADVSANQRKIMDEWLVPLSQGDVLVRDYYYPIRYLTNPDATMRYLRGEGCMGAIQDPADTQPAAAFPLDPVRALPWHPDSPRRGHIEISGPMQVERIRGELVTALVREASGFVALLLGAAATGMEKTASEAWSRLTKPPPVAMAAAGPETESNPEAPDDQP